MSWLKGYENQKRIVYVIMFIAIAIPILHPLGLPITVSQYTQDYYNTIVNLPPGSVVLVHYGGDAASWGELGPQVLDTTQLLMTRPLKVIYFSAWTMGSQWIDYALKHVNTDGKQYGVDYINIGYVAGWDTGLAALATDFHGVVHNDYYGNSIAGTFLDNVKTGADIALIITFDSGSASATSFLMQFQQKFNNKVIAGETGVMLPTMLPYYNAGQISGLLSSVRGAGELEILTKTPGLGVESTDVLSIAHLWLIAAVVIGNIVYFRGRGGKK